MKKGIEGEYEYQAWPSWATGPNGERQIFGSEAEVPAGWTHHGETKKGRSAPPPPPVGNTSSAPVTNTDGVEVDAAGTPFDPLRHAATKSKTKAGLWRMAVGVSRPESESAVAPPAPPAPPPPPPAE